MKIEMLLLEGVIKILIKINLKKIYNLFIFINYAF